MRGIWEPKGAKLSLGHLRLCQIMLAFTCLNPYTTFLFNGKFLSLIIMIALSLEVKYHIIRTILYVLRYRISVVYYSITEF